MNGNHWLLVKQKTQTVIRDLNQTAFVNCSDRENRQGKLRSPLSGSRLCRNAACWLFVYDPELMCGRRSDLVQLRAVSAERLTTAADTARRLPVGGQRVYVGQRWARVL